MKMDYISARGDRLPLVDNNLFILTNIDGLTTANAAISSSVIGGADGAVVTNVQANPRTLVIDLRIKDSVDVEEAKRAVLKVVKVKQRGTLEWSQNDRTVAISGIVESIEMPRWRNAVTMQITLHCEQPFWEDIALVIKQINEAIDLHYFVDAETDMLYFPDGGVVLGEYDTIRTKAFHNDGDVAVGLEISIVALDTVTNPIIYDGNGNFFGVGYGDGAKQVVMQAGDNIVITTHKGKKSVKFGSRNLLPYVKPQSTWLQLQAGDNLFTIDSDDENLSNMSFYLIYKQRYV